MTIEVQGLTKRYGNALAVNEINFKVQTGELFGFLGRNGAGKTTTVRMLTGLIKPDSGTARIMGYDILSDAIRARQLMGILPESSNAYLDLTPEQNISIMGRLYGVQKTAAITASKELLAQYGLHDKQNVPVKKLSKGMKQKLLFCLALVGNPKILVLDEPTSGLDVQSAKLIKDSIRSLNASGITVFITTHNMEEANQLCDRVAIINTGKIVAIGKPEELKRSIRQVHSVEVSFDGICDPGVLSAIRGVVGVERFGDKMRLKTEDPGGVACSLADLARSKNLKVVSLTTAPPSMEDVFLEYTNGGRNGEQ